MADVLWLWTAHVENNAISWKKNSAGGDFYRFFYLFYSVLYTSITKSHTYVSQSGHSA